MDLLVEQIQNRLLRQNKNWLCAITGETGSGKSYISLTLAEAIDPSFNINHVVFSPEEFMSLLISGTLHEGNVIIIDEAQMTMPSREWYSVSNRCINYVLSTFRHDNLAVIFTVPSLSFIDSQSRILFHTYVETINIDYIKEKVAVKWLNLQYNGRMNKLYYQYPVLRTGDGKKIKLNRVFFPKPSQGIIDSYEKKKQFWSLQLKKDMEKKIREKNHERNRWEKPMEAMEEGLLMGEWMKRTGLSRATWYRYNKLFLKNKNRRI